MALAATGILVVHNSNDGLMWIVDPQTSTVIQQPNVYMTLIEAMIGNPNYIMDDTWIGINQHPVTRIRVCSPTIPRVN
jgi:hypothetical protein